MLSDMQRLHGLDRVQEGYGWEEAALIIGCSQFSLRWHACFMASGSVWKIPELQNLHGDAALGNDELRHAILSLVEAEQAAFLRDHVDLLVRLSLHFPAVDHRYVSASTVHRVLRHRGYTRKKVERLFIEPSEEAQQELAEVLLDVPMRCLMSVDETHTNGGDVFRRFGRSPNGVRCEMRDRDPRSVPSTSTMMGVFMTRGVIWLHTVELPPAQTADDWRLFWQCLGEEMNRYVPGLPCDVQPDACVVLYDNAGIHDLHSDEFMNANGMYHVRLSAYSPNLMPIECVFSELKKHVRELVQHNANYLDKPRQLMPDATSLLTLPQIAGQFTRRTNKLAALLN